MGLRSVSSLLALGFAFTGYAQQTAYDQPYRPQFHFSPRENWTNDPNGLVYFEGEYHLFFQYNPFGGQWGHMSWGHAVTRDLVHWQQLPVALPEENGVMIFTGSTVIDEHNTSGFCTGGKPCMVAVYTGYTAKTSSKSSLQTQNVAYSNDRGRTWTKYTGNPVLDLHMSDFRDPKVLWSTASKQWIMAVSMPDDHKARFYGSGNLKQWKQISEFGPAGATSGQWECPELFELPVEGKPGQTRWVLKVGLNPGALQGGSGEQYFVGQFDGAKFVNDNPSKLTLWTDYGKDCYCALTFSGLPKNHQQVMIGWMSNWQYAAALPTSPWRGQMTIPRQLALRTTSEGLRLIQKPFEGLNSLRDTHVAVTGSQLPGNVANSHSFQLQSTTRLGSADEVGWRLLANDGTATVIGYKRSQKQLFVDRTNSNALAFSAPFASRINAPLTLSNDTLRLNILVDRSSIELFADDGSVTMTNLVFPPANAKGMNFYAKGGAPASSSAEIWTLRSIW